MTLSISGWYDLVKIVLNHSHATLIQDARKLEIEAADRTSSPLLGPEFTQERNNGEMKEGDNKRGGNVEDKMDGFIGDKR